MSYRLALHPADPAFRPVSPDDLIATLQRIGLVGAPWTDGGAHRFLIGDHFLQLVTFMGCAPAIALEPPAEGAGNFCHVQLRVLDDGPRLYADRRHFNPRCPHCGKRSPQWRAALAQWECAPDAPVPCPLCAAPASAAALDFREGAALACTFIEIHDIHPREALPTEALFRALTEATGTAWQHAYLD